MHLRGVTRLLSTPPAPDLGAVPTPGSWPPPVDPALEVIEVESEPPARYAARPVRPAAQRAARVGLWGAVAFGCIGGIAGLVRPSPAPAEPVTVATVDDDVPAPVAGVAEVVVEAWLTAGDDDAERLDVLFVDGVSLAERGGEALAVGDVTTVAGRRVQEGYWAVTVAAEVTEPAAEVDAAGDPAEPAVATWFVEVGIVGAPDAGLAALTTPAILPGPPPVAEEWGRSDRGARTPDGDDPLVATVQGFLRALLTGEGDPSRYLPPGETISAADPPPFAELVVLEMAVIGDAEDGEVRVWTQVQVTTPGGARRVVAYEVVASQRVDRWEIVELSGVPTLVEAPEGGEPDGAATDPTVVDDL